MEIWDLARAAIGAVIGFVLAQLVNVAVIVWKWCRRPRLVIELANGSGRILSHVDEVQRGEYLRKIVYGFYVRNKGPQIATGVRFQLTKIEHRTDEKGDFSEISDQAYDLALYNGGGSRKGDSRVVLVPGAAALVNLAGWREDYDQIIPSVTGLPDYFAEGTAVSNEFRLTVVAFDEDRNYATKVLTIGF